MNKTELAIAYISGAELIKYYIMPDGVMGLLIVMRRKVFNLSSGEKYFDSLEQAALRAFAACPDAAEDELTRKLLAERAGAEISPVCRQYENTCGTYEKKLPFEKDTVSSFLQMTEYYLNMIYEKLGYEAIFPGELRGYRRKYSLSFRLNGERKTIPFSYSENGSCFEMVFGNAIEASDSIRLSLKYTFGMISVTAEVSCKKHMRIENTFDMRCKTEKLRIFNETEIVYDSTGNIASIPCDIPKEIEMICTSERYELMELPFTFVYFTDNENKAEMIAAQKSRSDKITALYHSERKYLSCEKSIVTGSMTAFHEIFCTDGKRNICTHFLPTGTFSRGLYKQNFENRYFYRSFDEIGGNKNGS